MSDVVGGWIAGAAWLLACVIAYRFAKSRGGRTGEDREQWSERLITVPAEQVFVPDASDAKLKESWARGTAKRHP